MNYEALETLAKIRDLKVKKYTRLGYGEYAAKHANQLVIDMSKEFEKNSSLYGEAEALRSLTEYHDDCQKVEDNWVPA